MRKEFLIERQGKQVVLYAGLLDLAHQSGLKSIVTNLVQIPAEENHNTAICQATVVMVQGGVEKVFTGTGDASPSNVAPAMKICLLRMAETRAKARALRDATNVGVVAFEELGDSDPHDQPSPALRPSATKVGKAFAVDAPASEAQKKAIGNLRARAGLSTIPDETFVNYSQEAAAIIIRNGGRLVNEPE